MSGIVVAPRDYGKGIWVKAVTFVSGMSRDVRVLGYEVPGRIREWQDGSEDADNLVYVKVFVETAWRNPKELP